MQVFISWSGSQSNAVAVALRAWLPKVLAQKVRPFVSSEDIDKGSRGLAVIASELANSGFGIVVVTPTNQQSMWVNFEAGALGKSVSDGKVAPLLVGLTDANLNGPLKQFQNSAASDREAVLALVQSINKSHPEPLPAETVATLFDASWDDLERAIDAALELDLTKPTHRDQSELLDEVLTTVRSLQREVSRLRQAVNASGGEGWTGLNTDRRENARVHWSAFEEVAIKDLVRSMLVSEGARSFGFHSGDDFFSVDLPDDCPTLSPEVLKDIQGLAASRKTTITISRPDNSYVSYDDQGVETRSS